MHSKFPIVKAIAAIWISLWMAVFACLAGCFQPIFFRSEAKAQTGVNERGAHKHAHAGNMECCKPSGRNPSAPSKDKKPSGENASCCPLEATVIQKREAPSSAPAAVNVPSLDFHFAFTQFSFPVEFTQVIGKSGRDTLLKTHVLRI
jgi:hypothetical protein